MGEGGVTLSIDDGGIFVDASAGAPSCCNQYNCHTVCNSDCVFSAYNCVTICCILDLTMSFSSQRIASTDGYYTPRCAWWVLHAKVCVYYPAGVCLSLSRITRLVYITLGLGLGLQMLQHRFALLSAVVVVNLISRLFRMTLKNGNKNVWHILNCT